METVIEHALNDLMTRVRAADLRAPGSEGPIHFFFTLSKPVEAEIGPDILKLFVKQLEDHYPETAIEAQGYLADGYNIKATVRQK